MILLCLLTDALSIYRYFVTNTETDTATFPCGSIEIVLNEYVKSSFIPAKYVVKVQKSSIAYDITDIELACVNSAEKSIYDKYPELLL